MVIFDAVGVDKVGSNLGLLDAEEKAATVDGGKRPTANPVIEGEAGVDLDAALARGSHAAEAPAIGGVYVKPDMWLSDGERGSAVVIVHGGEVLQATGW